MDIEKFRNLTDAELQHQQRELNDQLFRMKFQLKMGQTESLNKIRGLRKDVARIHTVIREKQLGLEPHQAAATTTAEPAEGGETTTTKKSAHTVHKKPAGRTKAKSARKSTAKTKAKARKK